ncbi:MAG: T9SS type A sorting domain-containing protein [Bacteroidota bacterium]
MKTKLSFLVILFSVKLLAQVPTSNLDSEYQFTNNILDTFGTAENLTQTGTAATFTSDRIGNTTSAINLTGDTFRRVPLQNATSMSISFWIKTSTNDTNVRTILEQSQRVNTVNDNSSRGWYVSLSNGIVSFSCNYLWRWTANGGTNVYTGHSNWRNTSSNTNIADNNWHHVVITIAGRTYNNYTPTTSHKAFENKYDIYIDNVLKNTYLHVYNATTATGGNSTSLPDFLPNNNVGVGTNSYANLVTANRYTQELDDIRFYKAALAASGVASLYNESLTLGTSDFNDFSDFSIYPNPSNSIVMVNSAENIESIEILSLEGRKIKSVSGSSIDITELSNGMYVMIVKTIEGKMGTKKIIKN